MKPLVSILIPAYNAEAWISDTLRSAIAQTWERNEIIVVDDGSKDQTLAVARQFESEQVRVVTQKNQGAGGNQEQRLLSLPGRLYSVPGCRRSDGTRQSCHTDECLGPVPELSDAAIRELGEVSLSISPDEIHS